MLTIAAAEVGFETVAVADQDALLPLLLCELLGVHPATPLIQGSLSLTVSAAALLICCPLLMLRWVFRMFPVSAANANLSCSCNFTCNLF
jgi:hypothetical protein